MKTATMGFANLTVLLLAANVAFVIGQGFIDPGASTSTSVKAIDYFDEASKARMRSAPNSRGLPCQFKRGPKWKFGLCSYIGDELCQRKGIVEGLQEDPSSPEFKRALKKARAPNRNCGFDGNDFTICCNYDKRLLRKKLDKQCGIRETSSNRGKRSPLVPIIPGGTQVSSFGAWPWMAALGAPKGDGQFAVVCGGTLVSSDSILTAAHCFPTEEKGTPAHAQITHARVGDNDIGSSADGDGLDIEICDIVQHTRFDLSNGVHNDLAIVKLCRPISPADNIGYACLPDDPEVYPVADGEELKVLGWGAEYFGGGPVDKLREATVTVVPLDDCRSPYLEVDPDLRIDSKVICAGGKEADSCGGDSGGPILQRRNGRWTLVGVVSFGFGCANERFPGVYFNAARYFNFIHNNLNIRRIKN